VTSGIKDQGQFKVCGTCLKEYIDQEAAKTKEHNKEKQKVRGGH
jgi:hypothetical protein